MNKIIQQVYSKMCLKNILPLKKILLCQTMFRHFYLNLIEVFLLNFCCGILTLRVETGRRQRVREDTTGQIRSLKLEERVCSICSSGEVEDEYHFLLKCNIFAAVRVDYINNIMRKNADFINLTLEQKIAFLIITCWKETLNFKCKAWAKRKTCLYV